MSSEIIATIYCILSYPVNILLFSLIYAFSKYHFQEMLETSEVWMIKILLLLSPLSLIAVFVFLSIFLLCKAIHFIFNKIDFVSLLLLRSVVKLGKGLKLWNFKHWRNT